MVNFRGGQKSTFIADFFIEILGGRVKIVNLMGCIGGDTPLYTPMVMCDVMFDPHEAAAGESS
jgi:hypothetical protein